MKQDIFKYMQVVLVTILFVRVVAEQVQHSRLTTDTLYMINNNRIDVVQSNTGQTSTHKPYIP